VRATHTNWSVLSSGGFYPPTPSKFIASFLQIFPNFPLVSPNFSKDSFGGFVRFQGVTMRCKVFFRDSKFFARKGSENTPTPNSTLPQPTLFRNKKGAAFDIGFLGDAGVIFESSGKRRTFPHRLCDVAPSA